MFPMAIGLNTSNEYKKIVKILSFIIILVPRVLVDQNSVDDLENYYKAFQRILDYEWPEIFFTGTEPGFMLYVFLIRCVSSSFIFYLLVYNLILLCSIYNFVFKFSKNPYLSIIFFFLVFFNPSLFLIRQYIAASILLYTYPYIINRNIRAFLLLVLLACSFHFSSIVWVPIYFMYGIKKKYVIPVVTIFCLFLFAIFSRLQSFLVSYELFERYSAYVDESGSLTQCFIFLVYLLVFYIFSTNKIFRDERLKLIFWLLLIGTICSGMGFFIQEVVRLFLYYNFVILLLIPETLFLMKKRYFRILYFMSVFLINYYISFILYLSNIENFKLVTL